MESKKMKLTTVVLALLCILCVALAFIGYHRVKAEQNLFSTQQIMLCTETVMSVFLTIPKAEA